MILIMRTNCSLRRSALQPLNRTVDTSEIQTEISADVCVCVYVCFEHSLQHRRVFSAVYHIKKWACASTLTHSAQINIFRNSIFDGIISRRCEVVNIFCRSLKRIWRARIWPKIFITRTGILFLCVFSPEFIRFIFQSSYETRHLAWFACTSLLQTSIMMAIASICFYRSQLLRLIYTSQTRDANENSCRRQNTINNWQCDVYSICIYYHESDSLNRFMIITRVLTCSEVSLAAEYE